MSKSQRRRTGPKMHIVVSAKNRRPLTDEEKVAALRDLFSAYAPTPVNFTDAQRDEIRAMISEMLAQYEKKKKWGERWKE